MTLKDASQIAEEARLVIAPLCAVGPDGAPLCHIAGSVRRQKMDMIKDVEVVAVPAGVHLYALADIVNKKWGEPQIGKYPSKYTRIRGRYNLDMFWCTRETFGLNFFIRTGPDSFCRRALAAWKVKTNGGYSEEAQLRMANGTIVPTPTEMAVFEALGWKFVKPENRA